MDEKVFSIMEKIIAERVNALVAVAREREECARVCEKFISHNYSGKFLSGYMAGVADCVKAIRDRG